MGKRLLKCSTSTDVEEYKCIFEDEDAHVYDPRTILVQGLDCTLPVADIRSALRKHFGSCGLITRVFVPTECKTGSLLGCALINYFHPNDEKKALALDGSFLGGTQLEVLLKGNSSGSSIFPNFKRCERCVLLQRKRLHDLYITTNGGLRMNNLAVWKKHKAKKVEEEKRS